MRVKPVPPAPSSLETVGRVQRAVPLVPASEEDCCARLVSRLPIPGRDVAATWLSFLRGLGLVEERERGFVRTDRSPDPGYLAEAVPDRIYGAEEVLSVLRDADGALPAAEVAARTADAVSTWERRRNPGTWRDLWRERVARVLDWLVLLDLVERTDDGFRVG